MQRPDFLAGIPRPKCLQLSVHHHGWGGKLRDQRLGCICGVVRSLGVLEGIEPFMSQSKVDAMCKQMYAHHKDDEIWTTTHAVLALAEREKGRRPKSGPGKLQTTSKGHSRCPTLRSLDLACIDGRCLFFNTVPRPVVTKGTGLKVSTLALWCLPWVKTH